MQPTERGRPALRPLLERGTPVSTGLFRTGAPAPEANIENDVAAKRPRIAFQTPLPTPGAGGHPGNAAAVYQTPTSSRPVDRGAGGLPTATGDLLDYLKGRGGKIKELEDEVTKLRAQTKQAQQELLAKSEQIARLEAEVKAAKVFSSLAVNAGAPSSTAAQLEALLDEELAKSVRLEEQLMTAREQQVAAERRAEALEAALQNNAAESSRDVRALQAQLLQAEQQHSTAQLEAAEKVCSAELAARMARAERDSQEAQCRAAQAQLQQLQAQLGEREGQVQALQQQLMEAQPRVLSAQVASRTAQEQQLRIKSLEEQVRQRDEELDQMRSRLAAASLGSGSSSGLALLPHDEACSPALLAQLRAQVALLEEQCTTWQRALQAFPGTKSADDLAAAGRQLSHESAELQRSLADKDGQLLQAQALAASTHQRLAGATQEAEELRQQMQSALLAQQVAESRLAVVVQERDALRRSIVSPPTLDKADTVSGRLALAQQAARAAELEALNTQLQQQVNALRSEVAELKVHEAGAQAAARTATARAETAEAQLRKLEKEADSLAHDVATLQEKLGRGEFNRSSVRVLHLKMNPEAEYHAASRDGDLRALQAENASLREQLARMERERDAAASGSEGGSGGPPQPQQAVGVAVALKEAEVTVLQHKVGELEKAMARLKEVFKERISVFREACYWLFGYKVDMTAEATHAKDAASAPTTFSLRPQHCDEPGALLVFRYTKDRGMELVPNGWTARLQREVDTFVRKFGSIPAFTANITMENFQKQTQC